MRPGEEALAHRLDAELQAFDEERRSLPGIRGAARRESFVEQLVESIRRIRFVSVLSERGEKFSSLRKNPHSDMFDPLRAAVLHRQAGNGEEAFWLVFLFVHFGKNRRTGWRLARDVYGGLGEIIWDWNRTKENPKAFREWLAAHQITLQGRDGIERHFGNHRKYESIDAASSNGTGAVVESYVEWVRPHGAHSRLMQAAEENGGGDSRRAFDHVYRSMAVVRRFGRTARFDYLTMIGKLGLAAIAPGSAYLTGATGPLSGARLLFGVKKAGATRPPDLDRWLVELQGELSLGNFGMQILEDALCNWQKSPGIFKAFRG